MTDSEQREVLIQERRELQAFAASLGWQRVRKEYEVHLHRLMGLAVSADDPTKMAKAIGGAGAIRDLIEYPQARLLELNNMLESDKLAREFAQELDGRALNR